MEDGKGGDCLNCDLCDFGDYLDCPSLDDFFKMTVDN